MLVIVDYGMGNLFSIQQACSKVGIDAVISNDPEDIWRASGIILPGVGAFPAAMDKLRALALVDTIKSYASAGRYVFGICLGMQLMMERSEENGGADGLGWFEGTCRRIEADRIPNVGWRMAKPTDSWSYTPLEGINPTPFYFSHSYQVSGNSVIVCAEAEGIPALIGTRNIWGMQFHPEKSGPAGLRVFENIKRMMDR